MRNFKIVAAIAAALCVTFAFGGVASAHQSGKNYICAYGKKVANAGHVYGNVYMVLAVSPKAEGPTRCKIFNSSFKGTKEHLPQKLGTGKLYCKFVYSKKSLSILAVGMADTDALGKAFCTGVKKSLGPDWKVVK